MTARTRNIRRCVGQAASARRILYRLESQARRLHERIVESEMALALLMPRLIEARDTHRLAERAVFLAREADR